MSVADVRHACYKLTAHCRGLGRKSADIDTLPAPCQCIHFYFIMEGEVAQERGGVLLGTVAEGNFLVGAADGCATPSVLH